MMVDLERFIRPVDDPVVSYRTRGRRQSARVGSGRGSEAIAGHDNPIADGTSMSPVGYACARGW